MTLAEQISDRSDICRHLYLAKSLCGVIGEELFS